MHSQRLIPKLFPLTISALLLCAFSLAASSVGASTEGSDVADERGSCPLEADAQSARADQALSGDGKVVPPGPLRLQLCRYYERDGKARLAPPRTYASPAVARSFARRFNRLPYPPPARQCASQAGYITAYFGYQRRVIPVTITLGGCRLVSGASREAFATPDLISDLAELTSNREVHLPGPEREVSAFSGR
jgi:hypothetical protein